MILRSADKSAFVILGRSTGVKAIPLYGGGPKWGILCLGPMDNEDGQLVAGVLLGEYETKEDAMDVMKRIYKALIASENYDLPSAKSVALDRKHRGWRNRPDELEQFVESGKMSIRTYNCLIRADIRCLDELRERSEADLLKIRNLGEHCIKEIKAIIADAQTWNSSDYNTNQGG